LTGDKIETAINIAFSCALLTPLMERLMIDGKTMDTIREAMENCLRQLGENVEASKEFALIISGDALIHVMNEPLLKKKASFFFSHNSPLDD